jgi:superfamily II DNA or RNA helicase
MKILKGNIYSEMVDFPVSAIGKVSLALKFPLKSRRIALAKHIEKHGETCQFCEGKRCAKCEYLGKTFLDPRVPDLIKALKKKTGTDFDILRRQAADIFADCQTCNWDWYFRFVNKNKVPTGLLDMVFETIGPVAVEDIRVRPEGTPIPCPIELRPYQQEALDAILEKGQGICEIATGGGKTEVAICAYCSLGLNTLICVPTTAIFNEFTTRFTQYFPDMLIGRIAAGKFDIQPITIAIMDDSWMDDKTKFAQVKNYFQFVLIDEHHRASAKTWWKSIMSMENAYYRIGQSATPFRDSEIEDIKLKACTGPILYSKKTDELQEEGFLSSATVHIKKAQVPDVKGDFTNVYRWGVATNQVRNKMISDIASDSLIEDKSVLILVSWLEQAEALKELMGTDIILFQGGDTVKQIEEKKAKFKQEKLAIGSPSVSLGLNIPQIDVLINGGAGKSPGNLQQKLGRSLRAYENKLQADVWDFYDVGSPILEEHSKDRIKTYESVLKKKVVYEN